MDFLGAPMSAAPTPARNRFDPWGWQTSRRMGRTTRPIAQRGRAAATKPIDPLVSGGATDSKIPAQSSEWLAASQCGLDQALAHFAERNCFPRHGRGTRRDYTKHVRDLLSPLCPPCPVPVPGACAPQFTL